MQTAYTSGANVRSMVCSPYIKSVFVTFMSDSNVASFRYAAHNGKNNSIVATADVYEGPFGKVTVMPDRVMTTAATARNVHLLDPEMAGWIPAMIFRRVVLPEPLGPVMATAEPDVTSSEGICKLNSLAGQEN